MADMIARLKVESSEYDSKIKRAAQGIQHLVEACHNAGGVLNVLEDENREFIKSLGSMETVSKSARGKIAELTTAFTDLKSVYNSLSQEEKNGEVGKELNKQLDIMKGRIQAGKQEIADITNELNGSSGLKDALNQVAGKLGLNIEQLTKFGTVLGATSAALKVAKDAFFQNESNVDEWGRTVAASEGIYDSFLQSLNNGDFSGFLQRIGEVISKAKEAYNALDELNTRMTIINPERTRLQARATELKATIRREGANSDAGMAAQAELRQLEGRLTQAFRTESKLNMNAFKAQVDAKLKNAGITLGKKDYDFLMRTFSSDASYMAMKRGAKGSVGREYDLESESTYKVDTRNMNQRLLDLFTDEWRKEYAPLLNAAFSARGGAASTMLSDARYLRGGNSGGHSGGKGGSSTDISLEETIRQAFEKAMMKADANVGSLKVPNVSVGPSDAYQAYAESMAKDFEKPLSPLQKLNEQLADLKANLETAPDTGTYQSIMGEIVKKEKEIADFKGMGDVKKSSDDLTKSWRAASSAISSVGSAMSGLKEPALNIATVIAQSIATIGLAYAENLAADKTADGNIWAFIAAAAATTISLATTIAQFHSATGYSTGGEIKGNSYSGDRIPIMANAGEIVLNKAQQNTLAQNLQGSGGGGFQLVGRLAGEDIILSAERAGKRMGYGQLMFWKGN